LQLRFYFIFPSTFSYPRRAAEARFRFALVANRRFRFARSSLAVASDYTATPFFCNRTPVFPPRRRKRSTATPP